MTSIDEPGRSELLRRVRYQLDRAGDALDLANMAVSRVLALEALDPTSREECASDVMVLRHKIDTLARGLSGE